MRSNEQMRRENKVYRAALQDMVELMREIVQNIKLSAPTAQNPSHVDVEDVLLLIRSKGILGPEMYTTYPLPEDEKVDKALTRLVGNHYALRLLIEYDLLKDD